MLPVLSNNNYAADQIMMTLSAIAYAQPDAIQSYLANPQYATGNEWALVWGPSATTGNLMYVVKWNFDNVYAVVIRGTVLNFNAATLVDLYEDLDVGYQAPWQYPYVAGAGVANGTLFALEELYGMRSAGLSLLAFLASLQTGGFVFVTGHSLGGCVATVLASWLQFQLAALRSHLILVPFTFAAPSAGNPTFADWFTNQIFQGRSWRYYNAIDIIPMTWNNLLGIKNLFPSPGPACPRTVQNIIDLLNTWLQDVDRVSYTQPNGAGNALGGTIVQTADWFSEVSVQHDHNTYLSLLGAPPVNIPSMIPNRRVKPKRIIPKAGEALPDTSAY